MHHCAGVKKHHFRRCGGLSIGPALRRAPKRLTRAKAGAVVKLGSEVVRGYFVARLRLCLSLKLSPFISRMWT